MPRREVTEKEKEEIRRRVQRHFAQIPFQGTLDTLGTLGETNYEVIERKNGGQR